MHDRESRATDDSKLVIAILSLLCSVLATTAVLLIISATYKPVIDIREVERIFALPASAFLPEPLERTLYATGIIITPLELYGFYLLFSRLFTGAWARFLERHFTRVIYPLLAGGLIIFASFLIRRNSVYVSTGVPATPLFLLTLAAATYALYLVLTGPPGGRLSRIAGGAVDWSFAALALISCLLVCLSCLFGLHSVTYDPIYLFSFNAVFHAVVQVYLGKAILVDFPHQYGLYPQFIEPLFRLTGLTVFGFTLLMAVLSGISLSCFIVFLRRLGTRVALVALGMTALIYFWYFSGRLINLPDPSFQGLPIRIIFPAISLVLVVSYLQSGSRTLYYFSFALYALSMLWNFDTGFVVFFAWLLLLLYLESSRWNFKGMLRHVATAAGTVAAVMVAFYGYLALRYGHPPDLGLLFEYQRLFYLYGNSMLPMPLWHPWMLVLLTYAIGLLMAIHALINGETSIRPRAILFLSILGVGYFSSYQGRSHDMCLLGALYPAGILLALFAEDLLERLKNKGGLGDTVLFVSILVFMVYGAASLALNAAKITQPIAQRLRPVFSRPVTQVAQSAAFIRENTLPEDEILVLSLNSGVYHLESGKASTLKLPSTTELALHSDWDKIYRFLETSPRPKVFVDFTLQYLSNSAKIADMLRREFRLAKRSTDGSMLLFVK